MPESENVSPPPSGRTPKRWKKLLVRGLLTAGALALLFHRPLLVWTLHTVAVQVARHENVELSLEIEGSVLTGLTLKNVHGKAEEDDGEKSPIRSIEIEYARFDYSLPRLLTRGVTEFLSSYELRNATLEIEPPPPKGLKRRQKLTNLLRDILQQPALFSNRVDIENFNITAHLPQGPLVLKGLNVQLAPDTPGSINVGEVSIPLIASWRNLHAEATYTGRRLIVGSFQLGEEIRVTRVELDGSRRAEGSNTLLANGNLFGGETEIFIQQQRRGRGNNAKLTASLKGLSLDALRDFLPGKPGMSGTVTDVDIDLVGTPDLPSSWKGIARLQADSGSFEKIRFDKGQVQLALEGGTARLSETFLATADNRLAFEFERNLPDSMDTLRREGVEVAFSLDAPDLDKISPGFASGSATARGKLHLSEGEFTATLDSSTPGLWFALPAIPADREDPLKITLGQGEARLSANLARLKRPTGTPWFDGLSVTASASLAPASTKEGAPSAALTTGEIALDAASATLRLEKGELIVDSAEFRRGENKARFEGRYRLPATRSETDWDRVDFDARFDIQAPSLALLNAASANALGGTLSAAGEFHRSRGETRGQGKIEARDLVFREFSAKRLSAEIPVEGNTARVNRFELDLNGVDKLAGEGSLELRPPFAYDARLAGSVNDLAAFQPLVKTPVGGSLQIDWHGTGRLKTLLHTGDGRVAVQKGRFGDMTGVEAEIAGVYSPESIDFKTFHLRSEQGSARAQIQLAEQRLQVRELRLELGKKGSITGQFALPLDLRTADKPETILPETGELEGELVLQQIDLAKIFPDTNPEPSNPAKSAKPANKAKNTAPAPEPGLGLRGLVDVSLNAAGTVAAPELTLTVKGRDLQSRRVEKLQPAALDASLILKEARLVLKGEARIPAVSPLQFGGELPFDLRSVIREKGVAPSTPLKASVKLPPSSAAVFAKLTPSLRYVEGRLSLDASARGTLANPVFDGGLQLAFPAIRFQNADLPGINNLQGDLRFSGNQLAIRRFQGDAAGGPFNASGRVLLEKWNEPQLDLRIKSQGTLLVRNDSLIVRTDSDLKIAGPLNSAKVSGKIGINKSRFFRDVDILPIGLPGRPTPERVSSPKQVSIDVAPVRGWTFDIAIRTTEPFIVRSNLAQGQATADLKLGGTGLAPTLDGTARIENFVASLPFSRLQIDHGFVRFNASDSFNPTLDIHGSSRLRDYTINVHIYGTAAAPETVFSSEPPLAQEEVIALLATGATTREFTENNQVLAGRAGILLLQDLYHKAFKKKTPPPSASPDKDKPLLDRFHLDVGTVDPRTGRQQVGGRFELSRQFEVGAGLDLEGDVKVQLRYLLRFR